MALTYSSRWPNSSTASLSADTLSSAYKICFSSVLAWSWLNLNVSYSCLMHRVASKTSLYLLASNYMLQYMYCGMQGQQWGILSSNVHFYIKSLQLSALKQLHCKLDVEKVRDWAFEAERYTSRTLCSVSAACCFKWRGSCFCLAVNRWQRASMSHCWAIRLVNLPSHLRCSCPKSIHSALASLKASSKSACRFDSCALQLWTSMETCMQDCKWQAQHRRLRTCTCSMCFSYCWQLKSKYCICDICKTAHGCFKIGSSNLWAAGFYGYFQELWESLPQELRQALIRHRHHRCAECEGLLAQ